LNRHFRRKVDFVDIEKMDDVFFRGDVIEVGQIIRRVKVGKTHRGSGLREDIGDVFGCRRFGRSAFVIDDCENAHYASVLTKT